MQVFISYLEIYNEIGYDLLDPTREVQAMEDLPQVSTPPLPAVCALACLCMHLTQLKETDLVTKLRVLLQ